MISSCFPPGPVSPRRPTVTLTSKNPTTVVGVPASAGPAGPVAPGVISVGTDVPTPVGLVDLAVPVEEAPVSVAVPDPEDRGVTITAGGVVPDRGEIVGTVGRKAVVPSRRRNCRKASRSIWFRIRRVWIR